MEALNTFIAKLTDAIINPAITVLALVAFGYFLFGVMMFIRNAGNAEERADGKRHMIWGIVGLAILFGAGAIINMLKTIVQ